MRETTKYTNYTEWKKRVKEVVLTGYDMVCRWSVLICRRSSIAGRLLLRHLIVD